MDGVWHEAVGFSLLLFFFFRSFVYTLNVGSTRGCIVFGYISLKESNVLAVMVFQTGNYEKFVHFVVGITACIHPKLIFYGTVVT